MVKVYSFRSCKGFVGADSAALVVATAALGGRLTPDPTDRWIARIQLFGASDQPAVVSAKFFV